MPFTFLTSSAQFHFFSRTKNNLLSATSFYSSCSDIINPILGSFCVPSCGTSSKDKDILSLHCPSTFMFMTRSYNVLNELSSLNCNMFFERTFVLNFLLSNSNSFNPNRCFPFHLVKFRDHSLLSISWSPVLHLTLFYALCLVMFQF